MNDVIRLSDQQFDYLKKLVINDLQRVIADKAYDATLNRADVLLNLIKMHALARRPANRNSMAVQATKQPDPVFIEEDEPEDVPIVKKVCKKCGKEKPMDEFPKNNYMKDGYCLDCEEKCKYGSEYDFCICPKKQKVRQKNENSI